MISSFVRSLCSPNMNCSSQSAVAMTPKFWVVCTGVGLGLLTLWMFATMSLKLVERYPVLKHIETALGGGPVVRAEAVDGAIVVSRRGGDFEIVSGYDLGVSYVSHDAEQVTLRLDESLTFVDLTPDAAIALRY